MTMTRTALGRYPRQIYIRERQGIAL